MLVLVLRLVLVLVLVVVVVSGLGRWWWRLDAMHRVSHWGQRLAASTVARATDIGSRRLA